MARQRITQGDDVYLPVAVTVNNQPDVITVGSTVTAQIYEFKSGLPVGSLISVSGAEPGSNWDPGGLIVLNLPKAITETFAAAAEYSIHVLIVEGGLRRSRHAINEIKVDKGYIA